MSEQSKPKREAHPTIFTERFKELFEKDETQEHFAKRVSLTRNTVAAYYNGYISWPTTDALCKICTSCKVSSDWLIGLSEVRTLDESIESACNTLGISEDIANLFLRFKADGISILLKESHLFSSDNYAYWLLITLDIHNYLECNPSKFHYPNVKTDLGNRDKDYVILNGHDGAKFYEYEITDILHRLLQKIHPAIDNEYITNYGLSGTQQKLEGDPNGTH